MIGHLIYTYDHLDDARISQEISKNFLTKTLDPIILIHAYNGKESFGYKQYLEDVLIRRKNIGHFEGACDLLNAGVKEAEKHKEIQYLLVTAADTWVLNEQFLKKIIEDMKKNNQIIATCAWDNRGIKDYDINFLMNLFKIGFASDFFILDMNWQRKVKLFPLDFKSIKEKFEDIKMFILGEPLYLENILAYSFLKIFYNNVQFKSGERKKKMILSIHHIKEREPIHFYDKEKGFWRRKMGWEEIGLYTYHNDEIDKKQKCISDKKELIGKFISKIRNTKDLSYFNRIG